MSFQPQRVVAVLQKLAKVTPFEVRFKKWHSERARVFAVDASLKNGTEYDLKLYIEYPIGSGKVSKVRTTPKQKSLKVLFYAYAHPNVLTT